MNYENFIKDGMLNLGEVIDRQKCSELYSKIENSREWGKSLFRTEEDVDKKMFPAATKENPNRGTNPGKGKCNFADSLDLTFIEENPKFKKTVEDILGKDCEIILKKFVVAVPEEWTPSWLKERNKNYSDNLNPYVKEEFRDVTYFRGIDYHMDIMDQVNTKPDIITVYVYLNDVGHDMSPLHVIKKSHRFCETIYPHKYDDEDDVNNQITLCDNDRKERLSKEILVAKKGTTFVWSSLTFHKTKPFISSDKPRISLRYTFKKNKNLKEKFVIDEFLEKNNLSNFRNLKNNTAIIQKAQNND